MLTRIFGLSILAATLAGCGYGVNERFRFNSAQDLAHYNAVATHIDTPAVGPGPDDSAICAASPDAVGHDGQIQYWDLSLEESLQICLAHSKVLHDLGGTVLHSPANIRTIHGPAIADTDPRYGVEAALSDFDAVFNSTVDSQHNDRLLNNVFFGGGTRDLRQDLDTFKNEIVKDTPTGTEFTIRQNAVYDHNNEPGNLFGSAWDTNVEMEARQHVLQGGGTEYNRIAGTHGAPGQYNGVLIARINTDIGLVDFQMGLRDLVSNVENAYWDLYFAYRDLDAKVAARDKALESWRNTHARFQAGRRGGEAEKEAAAREQYFQFQEEVQNAWSGRLVDGTQTNNGSSGGTLRGNGGVRVAERRLRLLLGLPASDGRLIRTSDEPSLARMIFTWEDILPEALTRRDELRRQRWQIKRRELELIASRNFLLPTFDVFGLYRWRGFGHDLVNSDTNTADFESALADFDSGKHEEWELGAEFSMPIGERKGHAAVRNAQLNLARERAVLEDQERQVVNDLSNAVADLDRAYEVAQTAYNRRMAALAEVAATKAAFEADKAPLDLYLESQRRLADSESRFFAALVDYALAIKNVHYEKGSLLEYNDVFLAESPWPDKAYSDAAKRRTSRWQGGINYTMKPGPVSAGPIDQEIGSPRRQIGQPTESGESGESIPPPAASMPEPPMEQDPGQPGPPRQGAPQEAPNQSAPPRFPSAAPPAPSPDTSTHQAPPPTKKGSEIQPGISQQPDLRPRVEHHIAVPTVRSADSATAGTVVPSASNLAQAAHADATRESVSIMTPRPRDFDSLQPSPDRRSQAAPIVTAAARQPLPTVALRTSDDRQPVDSENSAGRNDPKPQSAAEQPAKPSYIKTIPIPWSCSPAPKSSGAQNARSTAEVSAPAPATTKPPVPAAPSSWAESSFQSPAASDSRVAPAPITMPDVGSPARQFNHTISMSEPTARVQLPQNTAGVSAPATATTIHPVTPVSTSWPESSFRPSPAWGSAAPASVTVPDLGSPARQAIHTTSRSEPTAPAQPPPATVSQRPEWKAPSPPPAGMPPGQATSTIRAKNIEPSWSTGQHEQSPLSAGIKSLPPIAAHERSIPDGILQTSGILESGGVRRADAISPIDGAVRSDGSSQHSGVIRAYGSSEPSGVVRADGISQPGVVVRVSGVSPSSEQTQFSEPKQSGSANRQLPPSGILQSFPPSGRIQNLPPIGAAQSSEMKTEQPPTAETKPTSTPSTMQSLPPSAGPQSLPPL